MRNLDNDEYQLDSGAMRNLDDDDRGAMRNLANDDLLDGDGLVRPERARVLRAKDDATRAPPELSTLRDNTRTR